MSYFSSKFAILLSFLFLALSIQVNAQCFIDLEIDRDAQLHDVNSTTNYGASSELMAKRSSNGSITPIQRALFDFDWSCLPEEIQIDSAHLYLFYVATSAGHSHQGDNSCWLRRVDQAWTETGVT